MVVVVVSRMIDLLPVQMSGAQPVVPSSVGHRNLAQPQGGLSLFRRSRIVQPGEHVAHMLDADTVGADASKSSACYGCRHAAVRLPAHDRIQQFN